MGVKLTLDLKALRALGIVRRGRSNIPRFCGWAEIMSFINNAPSNHLGNLGAYLFATGSRISEAKTIRPSNFSYETIDGAEYLIGALNVLKKRKNASPTERIRIVPLPLTEPTTNVLIKQFERVDKDEILFPYSRNWYWILVNKYRPEWWLHRFRSERASQLVSEYGYDTIPLVKFFNWSNPSEAMTYARLDSRDLALLMRKP